MIFQQPEHSIWTRKYSCHYWNNTVVNLHTRCFHGSCFYGKTAWFESPRKILVSLLFLVVFISFCISRYYFSQIFRTSFNIIWKKDFCHKFSFFNGFTQNSYPLNGQNLPSIAKVFCQCSFIQYHSCYGWKWPFLAEDHHTKLKNIHNSVKQNIWYSDKMKGFWKLIIWFCYFCKKNLFFVLAMAHSDKNKVE